MSGHFKTPASENSPLLVISFQVKTFFRDQDVTGPWSLDPPLNCVMEGHDQVPSKSPVFNVTFPDAYGCCAGRKTELLSGRKQQIEARCLVSCHCRVSTLFLCCQTTCILRQCKERTFPRLFSPSGERLGILHDCTRTFAAMKEVVHSFNSQRVYLYSIVLLRCCRKIQPHKGEVLSFEMGLSCKQLKNKTPIAF